MTSSADTEETCRVREVECRSVLNKSGLSDYAVNCYAGCEHGCVYCYARFVTRFSHPGEPWGSFVDVKANAPQVLAREVKRKRLGRVFLSSVCDGWQPGEARYGLTRQCLEMLLRYRFPVSILTKNALAGRDLDVLSSSKDEVELGVTITTFDEGLRQLIEPGSSPSAERLNLLQEARRRGIRTYAFLGPLMPGLSDNKENITQLLKAVKDAGVDYFYVDRLNSRFGVWQSLKSLLQKHYPDLIEVYRKLLFNEGAREEYSGRLVSSVNSLAKKHGLDGRMKLCF
jgi:DNA repair photolyase